MSVISKLKFDYLLIDDKYYGGNQEWYDKFFQKKAGCGPTTASSITMYENKKAYSKNEFIDLMNIMWNYLTPGMMGLNKVEYFEEGYKKFISDYNLKLNNFNKLLISKLKPSINELFDFLNEAIKNDHPIAFLNLDNGEEKVLDSWHWVTIVGIEYNREESILYATIADEGLLKTINLSLWLNTTKGEGGFIYFF